MLTKWFCLAFIAVFFVVVAAMPWLAAYEGWRERDPATALTGAMFCLLEVALALDWAVAA